MKKGDWVINIHDGTQGEVVTIDTSIPLYEAIEVSYEISPGILSNTFSFKSDWRVYPRSTAKIYPLMYWDGPKVTDSEALEKLAHVCELKDYTGLTESYKFCIHCDKKVTI